MKYRYLLIPVFDNDCVGTNDEKVFEEWKREFEDDAVVIIDLAAMKFLDSGMTEWKQVEEHKQ